MLGAAGGAGPTRDDFTPDTRRAGSTLTLRGATWAMETEAFAIFLRPLDDAERLTYITRTTGESIDPFLGKPGEPARFHAFLLVVENRGDDEIQFNPEHSWLQTNRKKIETPMGLTDLSFAYRLAGQELPEAYRNVATALLDLSSAIRGGTALTGLLVYPAVEAGTRRFHVDVDLTMPNGDFVAFRAPYERVKPQRRGKARP